MPIFLLYRKYIVTLTGESALYRKTFCESDMQLLSNTESVKAEVECVAKVILLWCEVFVQNKKPV